MACVYLTAVAYASHLVKKAENGVHITSSEEQQLLRSIKLIEINLRIRVLSHKNHATGFKICVPGPSPMPEEQQYVWFEM